MKNPQPIDLNTTLVQLTESLNKMDFTPKPYKPTIYPTGRGRGRSRGGQFQGRRFQGEVINPSTHNTEDEVEEASEENPEEENLIKVPPKEFPERILRPKMLIKIDTGTARKLVIG